LSSNNSLFSCGWREWYYHIREFIIARPTILQSTCWLGVYIYLSFSFSHLTSPHFTSHGKPKKKFNTKCIIFLLFWSTFSRHEFVVFSRPITNFNLLFSLLGLLHWIQLLEVLPY
jgi:hypothetical protein